MNVLVIQPGHGSVWLRHAHYEGVFVVGETWDDSGVGSPYMPDDFRGERITVSYPRRYILKVEGAA